MTAKLLDRIASLGWSRTATSRDVGGSVVILAFSFRLLPRRWANVTILWLSP